MYSWMSEMKNLLYQLVEEIEYQQFLWNPLYSPPQSHSTSFTKLTSILIWVLIILPLFFIDVPYMYISSSNTFRFAWFWAVVEWHSTYQVICFHSMLCFFIYSSLYLSPFFNCWLVFYAVYITFYLSIQLLMDIWVVFIFFSDNK